MVTVEEGAAEAVPDVVEPKPFPMDAKIVLKDLVKGVEFNGKVGQIKSAMKEGRHQVLVGKRFLNIRPANMEYQTKPVADLSVAELKNILKEKDAKINFAGMDASDMRRQVNQLDTETTFEYLAKGTYKAKLQKAKEDTEKAKHSNASTPGMPPGMSPDQLRQQARMMRSMNPNQIRSMNPQLRHMTDDQIAEAADQMEEMAENPEMMRMAANQAQGGRPGGRPQQRPQQTAAAAGYGTRTTAPNPADQLANMNPEQLKQQAQMMKSMDPNQLRAMNPQMAHMTDAQIEQAAQQMEMMASNPHMLEMARSQMKNMTPEDLRKMQEQGMQGMPGAGGGADSSMDPAKMLEQMDGKQLKQMMATMKGNPEMLSKMPGLGGKSPKEMEAMLSMFDNMSDEQMDAAVSAMKNVDKYTKPARNAYATVNSYCGGHLLKIVGLLVFSYFALFVYLRFFVAPTVTAASTVETLMEEEAVPIMAADEADTEF